MPGSNRERQVRNWIGSALTGIKTNQGIVLRSNVATVMACSLTLLLVASGMMSNLRSFITTEMNDAQAETSVTLETAVAGIQEEFRAGRESASRQMAEIRKLMRQAQQTSERNTISHKTRDEVDN